MKRTTIFLCILCALCLALVGCASGPVYEAKAKTFSKDGFTVTLTEAFREASVDGYTVCYDSSEVAVFVLKEAFTLMEGLGDLTLDEYAELVHQNNAAKNPEPIKEESGLCLMEYTFENTAEGKTYRYFSSMYKGSDAFFFIQFACEEAKYEEYRPYFVTWAGSVDVGTPS